MNGEIHQLASAMLYGRLGMAYIVQAGDGLDHNFVSLAAPDRKEALAIAIEWMSEGRTAVKIVGDGRIYTPKSLARVILND